MEESQEESWHAFVAGVQVLPGTLSHAFHQGTLGLGTGFCLDIGHYSFHS